MQEYLISYFTEYPNQAVLISLLVNAVVAVSGILPSFFVTGANLLFFGFWKGTFISFAGEVIGAGVAFVLYRKGFRTAAPSVIKKYSGLVRLSKVEGRDAFYLVFLLRILPFVPSGLVTLAAAIGKASFILFIAASSLGKIPALLIEAFSVYQVIRFDVMSQFILSAVLALGIYKLWKR